MKLLRSPIIISILLHCIVFVSIAWIKLENENDIKAKLSITIIEKKQVKLLKRSIPTRSLTALDNSIKKYVPETSTNISPINSPSYISYKQTASISHTADIQDIRYNFSPVEKRYYQSNEVISRPIITKLRQIEPTPAYINMDNTNRNKLIGDNLSVLAKPDIKFYQNDNNSLKKFIDAIRKKIEANKNYPLSAMNAEIEGRSEVVISILNNGQLESVKIINSSGNEALDNSALDSVRNSAPFPPIPKDLGRERIVISFYLVFKLSRLGR